VIGTLARVGEEKGYGVIVVSGDKDFRQILSPAVVLWDTMKNSRMDHEGFARQYGLNPGRSLT
jgi:DNA polymerase I